MSSQFIDLFSNNADKYAAARPQYPEELFRFIASVCPATERVWDCGTGNGQAALGLAKVFQCVMASDPSEKQISHAMPCERVTYSVQSAECTDYPDTFFDAVCVAQALHWFNFDQFYSEVRRVLRPSGIIAAWGYTWLQISPGFDKIFKEKVIDVINEEWMPQNLLLWNGYREIPFPFRRIEAPVFTINVNWNFEQFTAYINTWSATQRYTKKNGTRFLNEAIDAMLPAWGELTSCREIIIPLHLIIGRLQN